MKSFLKRRFLVIPLIVTAMIVIIAGTVFAATSITKPGQVNVVAATCDIEVYSDSACTNELSSVVWGDLPVGGERYRTVYLKNVGNSDANVEATLQSPPSGITLAEDTITIKRGTSAAFRLTLKATESAQLGTGNFTIAFTSTVVPG